MTLINTTSSCFLFCFDQSFFNLCVLKKWPSTHLAPDSEWGKAAGLLSQLCPDPLDQHYTNYCVPQQSHKCPQVWMWVCMWLWPYDGLATGPRCPLPRDPKRDKLGLEEEWINKKYIRSLSGKSAFCTNLHVCLVAIKTFWLYYHSFGHISILVYCQRNLKTFNIFSPLWGGFRSEMKQQISERIPEIQLHPAAEAVWDASCWGGGLLGGVANICKSGQCVRAHPAERRVPNLAAAGRWCGVWH